MAAKLDRKPSPPDSRDYKMSDFFTTAPAPTDFADMTVQEIADQDDLGWSFVLQLWALIKELRHHPTPPPTPPTPPVVAGTKIWPDAEQLDQLETGHCVGFGNAQWGNSLPFDDHFTDADAHSIYYKVKSLELGENVPDYNPPGSGPAVVEDGAYPRDGLKVMQSMGRLKNYARAAGTDDITQWVQQKGTVLVGSNWLAGMDKYDPNTFLMRATGASRGGHCYIINGFVQTGDETPWNVTYPMDVFTFQNSWGRSWGADGWAAMPVKDFAYLLTQQGEAWASVELPV